MDLDGTTGGSDNAPSSPVAGSSIRNRFMPAGSLSNGSLSQIANISDQNKPSAAEASANPVELPFHHQGQRSPSQSGHRNPRDLASTPLESAPDSSRWPPRLRALTHGSTSGSTTASKTSKSNMSNIAHDPLESSFEKEKDVSPQVLTFYQKYFTQPVDGDAESSSSSENRKFAIKSVGFLGSVFVFAILLATIIAPTVTVTLHAEAIRNRIDQPGDSPLHLAIFDNFPDPAIAYDKGIWYAFATNGAAGILQQPANVSRWEHGLSNVQLATSTDFRNWTQRNNSDDPLPQVGSWARQGHGVDDFPVPLANVWAPEVVQNAAGDWIMYYAASVNRKSEKSVLQMNPYPERINPDIHPLPHCIGAAISKSGTPLGPFAPINETVACEINQGGAIDPAAILDYDGTLWLIYKIDGNSIGFGGECNNSKKPVQPTPIMLQKMLPNGTATDGEPVEILNNIKSDGPLIEAPAVVRTHEGKYFLFFSSGCTRNHDYDVKYATADNITGPYVRAEKKLLKTGDWDLLAPGSVSVRGDSNGGYNMVFHARVKSDFGKIRAMYSTKLLFEGDTVRLDKDRSSEMESS